MVPDFQYIIGFTFKAMSYSLPGEYGFMAMTALITEIGCGIGTPLNDDAFALNKCIGNGFTDFIINTGKGREP